jgi:hypothetical protein
MKIEQTQLTICVDDVDGNTQYVLILPYSIEYVKKYYEYEFDVELNDDECMDILDNFHSEIERSIIHTLHDELMHQMMQFKIDNNQLTFGS